MTSEKREQARLAQGGVRPTPLDRYRPGYDAATHLIDLKKAIDKVQPLADYRGNLEAIYAVVVMFNAMTTVAEDFAFVCGKDWSKSLREAM